MIQVDDLILISVDDRLIEPPDLFAGHLDPRYQDRAPKLVPRADGSDVCTFGDAVVQTPALNAVAGPDDQVRKITHENAMGWYSFDPLPHVPKKDATVAGLRWRADGHDVSIMSRSRRVLSPDEKLDQFRGRARRAVAAAND